MSQFLYRFPFTLLFLFRSVSVSVSVSVSGSWSHSRSYSGFRFPAFQVPFHSSACRQNIRINLTGHNLYSPVNKHKTKRDSEYCLIAF